MKEFKGRVAVVTGGGGGIGRAMAERFGAEGMKLVLADVDQTVLDKTVEEFKAKGYEVIGVKTDVSKAEEVEALAARAIEAYGKVHVLCNNAGVAVAGTIWERTVADWEWVLGVNLWGVIHGIRVFVPLMLKHGEEGHVVNTASLAGLISGPGMSIYSVTKHSVVTMSETLHHELTMTGAKIGASVLCPAWVKTRINESERNRPKESASGAGKVSPAEEMMHKMVNSFIEQGLKPEEVAQKVFEAIRDNKFYIITHPQFKKAIEIRHKDIQEERNPTYVAI